MPADAPRALRLELDAPPGGGCALAEAAFVPAALARDARAQAPRRVLLVTSDTHRGDHLGASGSGVPVRTPNLDALAARGTLFLDCWVSANFTNPSHAALMTGTSPQATGITSNDRALDDAAPTLAERFAAAGFRTFAALSAHHLGDAVSGLGQGFDRVAWPDASQRPSGETLDALLPWLDEADDDPRPLFVWLHVFDAHLPYVPLPEFERLGYDGPADPFDPSRPPLPFDDRLPAGLHGLRDVEFARAEYRGCVASLDHELRRVFGRPALDDALVAVVGDHGESLGAHDIWFNHAGLYPDTLHVPLILAGPGVPAGRVESRPVRQVDLGRTLLDLAGLPDASFPGRSLVAPAADDDGTRFALASHATSASITRGRHHLVLQLVDHHQRWHAHDVELYDLVDDPDCTRDVTDAQLDVARELRARLIAWLDAAGCARWAGRVDDDAALHEQLAALGYVEGADASDAPLFVPDDCASCRRFR
ncbi:MAG: sulfatase [Planctomycetes bacterium]|nr:sulfatase [Planctomycetota bacterium]